jgi:hypothetical protein
MMATTTNRHDRMPFIGVISVKRQAPDHQHRRQFQAVKVLTAITILLLRRTFLKRKPGHHLDVTALLL